MGEAMTMAQRMLAQHAGVPYVSPGQLVECSVDLVLANDVTAPIAIREFERIGVPDVWDASRIALVPDHYVPNKDIKSAQQAAMVRAFAADKGIAHYYECGRCGIEHALLPEQGVVVPGDLVIGADSHTCTYGALGAFATGVGSTDVAVAFATGRCWFKVPQSIRVVVEGSFPDYVGAKDLILHLIGLLGVDGALYRALEFSGSTIAALDMAGRMTVANMVVEAGAKVGLMAVDRTTEDYECGRAERPWKAVTADEGASYERELHVNVESMAPLVACPSLPSNVRAASELADVNLDQVVIGSCTNGRIEDLREAAFVMCGKQVAPHVRCIVLPATQGVYRQALDEGLLATFVDAGCAVSTPTCGPCLGGHMGVLAPGEHALATTNRNFRGRMGHPSSQVYLASPTTAAASAVLGRVGLPSEVGVGAAALREARGGGAR